jgi:uncharacterized membrane protein YphA (DoxX/SURF4 family)
LAGIGGADSVRLLFHCAGRASHFIHFQQHSLVLKKKGVPLPRAATILTIVMMIAGSMLVLFNWHARVGALLLFGIIFPASFFRHHFFCIDFGTRRTPTCDSANLRIS